MTPEDFERAREEAEADLHRLGRLTMYDIEQIERWQDQADPVTDGIGCDKDIPHG